MNKDKLIALCNKYTVEISFNGFNFTHKVINADKLLKDIHTTTDIEMSKFIENINKGEFMTSEYEDIFKSIETVGMFKTKGDDALNGAKSYIECNRLNWLPYPLTQK